MARRPRVSAQEPSELTLHDVVSSERPWHPPEEYQNVLNRGISNTVNPGRLGQEWDMSFHRHGQGIWLQMSWSEFGSRNRKQHSRQFQQPGFHPGVWVVSEDPSQPFQGWQPHVPLAENPSNGNNALHWDGVCPLL